MEISRYFFEKTSIFTVFGLFLQRNPRFVFRQVPQFHDTTKKKEPVMALSRIFFGLLRLRRMKTALKALR